MISSWCSLSWGCAGDAAPGGYLTLRRLVVWLAEPLVRMRRLAGIADATAHLQGGELIIAVDALAQHGDALVQHVVSRVMEQMCHPLFHMITEWVFSGRLSSGDHEFFITSHGMPELHTGYEQPTPQHLHYCSWYMEVTAMPYMLCHASSDWLTISSVLKKQTEAAVVVQGQQLTCGIRGTGWMKPCGPPSSPSRWHAPSSELARASTS